MHTSPLRALNPNTNRQLSRAALIAAAALGLSVGTANADVMVTSGTLDVSTICPTVTVDGFTDPTATANIIDPAQVTSLIIQNAGNANVDGGTVGMEFSFSTSVGVTGAGTLNVGGGTIFGFVQAEDSNVNITDGFVELLHPGGTTTTNISGGTVYSHFAQDSSSTTVTGGNIEFLDAGDTGTLDVNGGTVLSMQVQDNASSTVNGGEVDEAIFKGFGSGSFLATTGTIGLDDVMLMNDTDFNDFPNTIPNTNNSEVDFSGVNVTNEVVVDGHGLARFLVTEPGADPSVLPNQVNRLIVNENGRAEVEDGNFDDLQFRGLGSGRFLATTAPININEGFFDNDEDTAPGNTNDGRTVSEFAGVNAANDPVDLTDSLTFDGFAEGRFLSNTAPGNLPTLRNDIGTVVSRGNSRIEAEDGDFDEVVFKGFSTGSFLANSNVDFGTGPESNLQLGDVMLMNDDDPGNEGQTLPGTNNSQVDFRGVKINTLTVDGLGGADFLRVDDFDNQIPNNVGTLRANENAQVNVDEGDFDEVIFKGLGSGQFLATSNTDFGGDLDSNIDVDSVMLMNEEDPMNPGQNTKSDFAGVRARNVDITGFGGARFLATSAVGAPFENQVDELFVRDDGMAEVTAGTFQNIQVEGRGGLDFIGGSVTGDPDDFSRPGINIIDDGVANVTGGTVSDVDIFDNGILNFSGGRASFGIDTHGTGTANFSGGTASGLGALDDSVINFSGGQTDFFLGAFDIAEVNVTGGTVGSPHFSSSLQAFGDGVINVFGGDINADLGLFDNGVINLFGTEFFVEPIGGTSLIAGGAGLLAMDDPFFGAVDILDGVITGVLVDGTPISVNFFRTSTLTTINLIEVIPEPSTVGLTLIGGALLGFGRREKKTAA